MSLKGKKFGKWRLKKILRGFNREDPLNFVFEIMYRNVRNARKTFFITFSLVTRFKVHETSKGSTFHATIALSFLHSPRFFFVSFKCQSFKHVRTQRKIIFRNFNSENKCSRIEIEQDLTQFSSFYFKFSSFFMYRKYVRKY